MLNIITTLSSFTFRLLIPWVDVFSPRQWWQWPLMSTLESQPIAACSYGTDTVISLQGIFDLLTTWQIHQWVPNFFSKKSKSCNMTAVAYSNPDFSLQLQFLSFPLTFPFWDLHRLFVHNLLYHAFRFLILECSRSYSVEFLTIHRGKQCEATLISR